MKVMLDSLDTIYSILSNFDDSDFGENIDDRISLKGFRYDFAILKYPLSEVSVSFRRTPGKYSVISFISSKDEKLLLTGGDNLAKKLEKNRYKFFPKNNSSDELEGCVDLLDYSDLRKGTRFSIQVLDNNNSLIGISIGGHGSLPLSFPSGESEFVRSVKSLEKLTNLFIENIYETNSICLDNFPEQVYLSF